MTLHDFYKTYIYLGIIFDQFRIMKKTLLFLLALCFYSHFVSAQLAVKDTGYNKVIIFKDPRLDLLAKKEMEFNANSVRSAKGYRLFVLKSNDRNEVMRVRSQLLQTFPDQKPYMIFQAPFIKLKFGDFVEKADAEKARDLILKTKIVPGSVYLVPEIVEVKPDKNKETELP